jgi:hypothetical protein
VGVGAGEEAAVTVTVTVFVTEPPAFVAVSVYVVVFEGSTLDEVPVTAPTPLKLSEVAPVALQPTFDAWPALIVAGVALKLLITGGAGLVAFGTVGAGVDGGGGVDEGGAPAATLLTAIVTEAVLLESVTLVAVSVAFPVFALAV